MMAQPRVRRHRLRRWLPRLVWIGDEIDVCVTFTENRLQPPSTADDALKQLLSGALPEIEERFAALGIEFDTGLGPDGRDWEWDWSLRGPISVRFRGRSSKRDRR